MGGTNHQKLVVYDIAIPTLVMFTSCNPSYKHLMHSNVTMNPFDQRRSAPYSCVGTGAPIDGINHSQMGGLMLLYQHQFGIPISSIEIWIKKVHGKMPLSERGHWQLGMGTRQRCWPNHKYMLWQVPSLKHDDHVSRARCDVATFLWYQEGFWPYQNWSKGPKWTCIKIVCPKI